MRFAIDITRYVQKAHLIMKKTPDEINVLLPLYSFNYDELRQLTYILSCMDSELLFYLDSALYEIDGVMFQKVEDGVIIADYTFVKVKNVKSLNERDYIPAHDFEMVLIDGETILNLSTFKVEAAEDDILYRINSIMHCGYHFR